MVIFQGIWVNLAAKRIRNIYIRKLKSFLLFV